jgi:hypothetical protein
MMSGPLVNGSSQTAAPFQFPFIVLLRHGRRRHLQPSTLELVASLSPSTSILIANFIPRHRQLQPSSPFKFQNCAISSILLDGRRDVLDAAAAR